MSNPADEGCLCPDPVDTDGRVKGGLCPLCGKRLNRVEALSDSMIEASFEILAEEGAIWSGAR